MGTETALRDLGVGEDTLSREEKLSLDEQGYAVLGGMSSAGQAAAFRKRLEELAAQEGDQASVEAHQNKGVFRLADLLNKDPMFE